MLLGHSGRPDGRMLSDISLRVLRNEPGPDRLDTIMLQKLSI
jgi:hypothetical protein